MPELKPRLERFCRAYVYYANAAHAAAHAGYKPQSCRKQGWRLMQDARVRTRIAELRKKLSREFAYDAGVLLGKLETVYERAVEDHLFSAAARAAEIQCKILGIFHDRRTQDDEPGLDPEAGSEPKHLTQH